METKKITELIEGESLFTSNGVSNIKITKNGQVVCLEVPIISSGITELVDSFDKNAPKPPVKDVKITPDSPMGKDMGVTKNEWIKIRDISDLEYLEKKQKHESSLGIAIVLKGMAVEIKDKEGNLVEDADKKIEIMRNTGMSGEQFSQIVADIQSLTKWSEEERKNFFV